MAGANQPLVVAIHGAPRSGTSWLGQLFNSSEHVAYRYQPLFSYAFKDRLKKYSSHREIQTFFQDLLASDDPFVLQQGKASLAGYSLTFPKSALTHVVYKEVRYHHLLEHLLGCYPLMKLVALIRDPRAVVHSWLRSPREFHPSWDPLSEWSTGTLKNENREENWFGYQRWKELAYLFLSLKTLFPRRVYLVTYEDLTSAPLETLRYLFRFSGIPFTSQVQDFLADSRRRDDGETYGVFRDGEDGGCEKWRTGLDQTIRKSIVSDLLGTPLEIFLRPDAPTPTL